jgi:two-component system OmpR family sensor kinase
MIGVRTHGAELGAFRARRHWLFLPWLVLSAVCLWLMWGAPGKEVVPFHIIWIAFALAYGFDPWQLRRALPALTAVAVASGAILVHRSTTGVIAWEETTEIPLMLLLAVLVVWHVQRREAALETITGLAARESDVAKQRERFTRVTSHEMRTPLTIASGYVDLLLARADDTARPDLEVVQDELGRLARAGDRLIRMIQLQDLPHRTKVDLEELLHETAHRWATVADRHWSVDAAGGVVLAVPDRLRAGLDTLIENAVRHTAPGDAIRLVSDRRGEHWWIGIADSGPGLTPDQALQVNRAPDAESPSPGQAAGEGPLARTGLGIGIVTDVAAAHGGKVAAGRSREGGALVLMVLPHNGAPAGS